MKISHCTYAALLSASLLVFSCCDFSNLAIPEKVSVKATNQSYSFSAGTGTITLSDHLNATTLLENITSDDEDSALADLSIYDYWPGGDSSGDKTQQFLFNYPVASIPLDFGEYLDNLDLLSSLSSALSETVTVPELTDVDFTKEITLPDINEIVASNFSLSETKLSVPELSSTASLDSSDFDGFNTINISINAPDFDTMEFTAGTLRITLGAPSTTPSTDFTLTASVQLLTQAGVQVAQSDEAELKAGGSLDLDISGCSIVPDMMLRFVGTYGGGSLGTVHTYALSSSLVDIELSKITGLTMTTAELGSYGVIDIGTQEIALSSLGTYLKSATISEGSLTLSGALPDSWSGIICTPDLLVEDEDGASTSGSSGLYIPNDDFTDVTASDSTSYLLNKYVDLAGKTITPSQTVTLTGSVSLALEDATIVLTSTDVQTVDLAGAVSVTEVSSATVDLDVLLEDKLSPVTKSQSLGDSVTSYVKSVVFNQIGAVASITTDLPSDSLQIGATITSDLFGITGTTLSDTTTLTTDEDGDTASGTLDLLTDDDWSCTITPEDDTEADFTIQMTVAGVDSNGNSTSEITVTNLAFGKEYTFSVSLELVYDWESITLNTASAVSFSGEQQTGLDLQSILGDYLENEQGDLLDQVRFGENMVGYLTVTRPVFTSTEEVTSDPLASFSDLFSANVAVKTYSSVDGQAVEDDTVIYLIGSADSNESISLVETSTDFASYANDDLLITKNLFADESSYSAKISNLASIFNDHETDGGHTLPADIAFVYEIGTGASEDITLTKDQIEALTADGSSAEISVDLSIVFPLELIILESTDSVGNGLGYGIKVDDLLALADVTYDEDVDLFKRDSADSDIAEQFDKYGEIVKTITLIYTIDNNTGLTMTGTMVLIEADEENNVTELSKTIIADGEEHSITLTNAEVVRVLSAEAYPIQPRLSMVIDDGTISVPRTGYFSVSAAATVVFDGTVTVYVKDED